MAENIFEQHVNSIDPDYCYHRKLQRRHVNTRIPGTVCGCPDCGVAYFIPDAIPDIEPVTVERIVHHYTEREKGAGLAELLIGAFFLLLVIAVIILT